MKLSYTLVTVAGLLQSVFAGAGAAVTGCIYLSTAPLEPFSVVFTAGASTDHCMNDRGSSSSTTVSKAGLTCSSLGYVELKASSSGGDTCATDKSWWGTSYTTSIGLSGSTNSQWYNSGEIALKNEVRGTHVCGQAALCTATTQQWDGTGSLWIIYEPYGGQVIDANAVKPASSNIAQKIMDL